MRARSPLALEQSTQLLQVAWHTLGSHTDLDLEPVISKIARVHVANTRRSAARFLGKSPEAPWHGAIANVLDPPVTPTPQPTPTPTPVPNDGIPALDPRFEPVKLTKFDGSSLPSDFYAYQRSDGNDGKGYRDPSAVSVRDCLLAASLRMAPEVAWRQLTGLPLSVDQDTATGDGAWLGLPVSAASSSDEPFQKSEPRRRLLNDRDKTGPGA
jgi:hypothetical protein